MLDIGYWMFDIGCWMLALSLSKGWMLDDGRKRAPGGERERERERERGRKGAW